MSTSPVSAEAWQITKPGPIPDTLQLRSITLPKLKPSQVLVKVSHAALNPVDYKLAALLPSFIQKSQYVEKGDRVFINGGTTAVGLLAADLAIAKGASLIVATASGSKADFIKKRGVNEVIDHRAGDPKQELRTLIIAGPSKNDLVEVNKHLAKGTIHPVVDRVFEWKDGVEAYKYLIEGRALGKVVVAVP
ncbi:unnamed protein product [Tilletia controversa]|nr:unnamed protein product [Tilletia controversa]